MSYQVLARKWRPRTFQELVGQTHAVRALSNALDHDRLHHAYLFTGTRGVGKTTIARILARSLNCEVGVSARPCGECGACREIDAGRFVDLIEVDAASRTKVEDTRELLDNVLYAPTRGRFKVYLIDEVHMLSTHSFNALLKTLEEPPPHVKFLLATTDPQRLPATILSRCLQFHLRRLPATAIAGHLRTVLDQEGIEAEPAALAQLARAGEGSMRDALSLLDQAIAYGGGRVGAAEVGEMLGTIDRGHVVALVDALAAADAGAVLARVGALADVVVDYASVLDDLVGLLQRIAVAQVVPGAVDDAVADPGEIRRLAAVLEPEDVQLYYQIGLLGRRDLGLSPDPRGGLEMVLLRMLCFRPAPEAVADAPPPSAPRAARAPDAPLPSRRPPPGREPGARHPEEAPPEPVGRAPAAVDLADWQGVIVALGLRGMVRELAVNCVPAGRQGAELRLRLDPAHAQLRTPNLEERLQGALARHLGEPLRLRLEVGEGPEETPARADARERARRQQQAVEAIQDDPTVRALCDTFEGRVDPGSIGPVD